MSGTQSHDGTIAKLKEGFHSRKVQEILRNEIAELKELAEVFKEINTLVKQVLEERRSMQIQIAAQSSGFINRNEQNMEQNNSQMEALYKRIEFLEESIGTLE